MIEFVYIIDDDADVRLDLRELVSSGGGRIVQTFATAEAFLERAPELDPGVVLLDLALPGMSGLELLEQLPSQRSHFVVLIQSGRGNIQAAVQAVRIGALDFLEKPYSRATLFAAIERAFELLRLSTAERVRRAEARRRYDTLSERERQIAELLLHGSTNRDIAHQLSISVRTAEVHRTKLMTKMRVDSLAELVRKLLLALEDSPPTRAADST
jgi:two-component system response regulator FixJ